MWRVDDNADKKFFSKLKKLIDIFKSNFTEKNWQALSENLWNFIAEWKHTNQRKLRKWF